MALYRSNLPQLSGGDFLTDSGLETTLVFHHGMDLPCFAAFPLVKNEDGRETLRAYFKPYLETARERNIGFISTQSHGAPTPVALGRHYQSRRRRLTQLCVLGGCCGTDHRHIVAICEACNPSSSFASSQDRELRAVS